MWKFPLKHDLTGCSEEVVDSISEDELFSAMCINREKLIYRTLPKNHPDVLECLDITEVGLRFPFMQLGNLCDYLRRNDARLLADDIRDRWIRSAAAATAFIHAHGIVHADISARNFLVADDLSIKLCDFTGSGIGDLAPMAEEEHRYRISPGAPWSFQTDLFALGCLMFEIEEIEDSDWQEVARRYEARIFPGVDGLKYGAVIHKCWTCQYQSAEQLLYDLDVHDRKMSE